MNSPSGGLLWQCWQPLLVQDTHRLGACRFAFYGFAECNRVRLWEDEPHLLRSHAFFESRSTHSAAATLVGVQRALGLTVKSDAVRQRVVQGGGVVPLGRKTHWGRNSVMSR